MNNEPVAIVELGGEVTWLTDVLPYKAKLYTHPVKELTLKKEEIHAVWASGEYYTLDKDGSIDEFHFADFAKAILRKAQEK